ncbi:hypothetical protein L615_009500000030 [Nocardioides sp. J9]|uniref:hypothetical protein n=1 Tax=Nocardioides sp. J9 TaxID=935844 RepID=UPI0011A6951D|nr:hypothetical protein [Nocardioides sp. J9]TWG89979.1 hypothetical protein L615_009500000030 [Nocardioides sp. J9]
MSEKNEEPRLGVPDEDLPEDLVADEDNPLAEGLPDGETVEGLLTEGKEGDEPVEGPDGDDAAQDQKPPI